MYMHRFQLAPSNGSTRESRLNGVHHKHDYKLEVFKVANNLAVQQVVKRLLSELLVYQFVPISTIFGYTFMVPTSMHKLIGLSCRILNLCMGPFRQLKLLWGTVGQPHSSYISPTRSLISRSHIRPLNICINIVSQLDEPNRIHGSPNVYKAMKLPQLSFLSSAIGEFAHMGSFSGSVLTETTQDW